MLVLVFCFFFLWDMFLLSVLSLLLMNSNHFLIS